MPSQQEPKKIAIIGGGAAGFFTALTLAEKCPMHQISLFESSTRPLQKVAISGGGRCNVTHHCFDPRLLVEHYPRGKKVLPSLFSRFQPQDTVAWFKAHGLTLVTEDDGRMFPKQNTSQAVIDLFMTLAKKNRITLHTQARITHITPSLERQGFHITHGKTHNTQTLSFDAIVLATGYSPVGWKLAASLGHTIIPPVPSLFPLKITHPLIQDLQGISIPSVKGRIKLAGKRHEAEGACLITHKGLSGPLIYRLSALAARELRQANYQSVLQLDWLPQMSSQEIQEQLKHTLYVEGKQKKLSNLSFSPIPQRLWQHMLIESGAHMEERGEVTSKKVFNRLTELLKNTSLPITGKNPSKEEFVSCGGVSLNEVNTRTMESRLVPNIFFAGEILDIDGLTGGFNFQACWSAAWVISEAFLEKQLVT